MAEAASSKVAARWRRLGKQQAEAEGVAEAASRSSRLGKQQAACACHGEHLPRGPPHAHATCRAQAARARHLPCTGRTRTPPAVHRPHRTAQPVPHDSGVKPGVAAGGPVRLSIPARGEGAKACPKAGRLV